MTVTMGIIAGWTLAGLFMTLWLFGQRTRAYSVDEAVAKARNEACRAVEFLQDVALPHSGNMANAVDSFLVPWACNDMASLRTVWPEWFAYRDRHLLPQQPEKSA
ncbi:hypothetical protein [Rhizobium sp. GCM10022189]|uniref:hypothetical protein n=1 Tax=Rhizobium sp. GCM10022189 TaxID=3252654 RepID=UPI00361FAE6D